ATLSLAPVDPVPYPANEPSSPTCIAILSVTEPLANPAVEAGIYRVCFAVDPGEDPRPGALPTTTLSLYTADGRRVAPWAGGMCTVLGDGDDPTHDAGFVNAHLARFRFVVEAWVGNSYRDLQFDLGLELAEPWPP
ncbi:MAG: hypothetical protein KDB80_09015, partial [Planctomycetes bacterium]|nr:hypothetical protein [Planctomycetota bacterium]